MACTSQNNGRTEVNLVILNNLLFHRQLSSVYRQNTCLIIEKISDPLFIKTHLFIKLGKKFQLLSLLGPLLY